MRKIDISEKKDSGLGHWWHQKLTAVALLPLTLWFLIVIPGFVSLNFEGKLEWPGGGTLSKGGFDIFSTSMGANFANPVNFSRLGGMWNDRLGDLRSINDYYYISSMFYNSMKLGDEFINSIGSSDAVLVKLDPVSHEVIDFTKLSSPVSDTVKFVYPVWLYVAITGVVVYLMISPYYETAL